MFVLRAISARRRLIITALIFSLMAAVYFLDQHSSTIADPDYTAVVGIAQVQNDTPSNDEIDAAVRQAVAYAGGLPAKIGPGKKVVIQPNLVLAGFSGDSGVVTNPQVIRTVIKLCLERGMSVQDITICEGAANFYGSTGGYTTRQMTRKAVKDCGLDLDGNMFEDTYNVRIVDANDVGQVYPDYPGYTGSYNSNYVTEVIKAGRLINRRYLLPNCVVQADAIIRCPTLKNHQFMGITGAFKLGFGFAPTDIYHSAGGVAQKDRLLHYNGWGFGELDTCARGMVDMNQCKPADFIVMDGLCGVTNGPAGGSGGVGGTPSYPSEGKMRCIIASTDPVAVDTVQTFACSYNPASIPHLAYAVNQGFGTNDSSKIQVIGVHVKTIKRLFPIWGCATRGDTASPVLGSLGITNGTYVWGRIVFKPSSASDTGSGLCKAEVCRGQNILGEAKYAPWQVTFDTSSYANYGYIFTYYIYDYHFNEAAQSVLLNVRSGDPIKGVLGLPNNTYASIEPVRYLGKAPALDFQTFFVASNDRGLPALRVYYNQGSVPNFSPGQRLMLYGIVKSSGGQRYLDCSICVPFEADSAIKPIYMSNAAIGGSRFNSYTPGVPGGAGAYNLGCLVKTSGIVSAGGSDFFYISDGSLPNGGRLKVKCGSIQQPTPGSLVSVKGFSCTENDGGVIKRLLVLSSDNEIIVHNQ